MRSRRSVLCMMLMALPAVAACRADPNDATPSRDARAAIPASAPSITGVVTSVQAERRLRIEENPDESAGSAKAVVRVTDDAIVLTRGGSTTSFQAIRTGMRVSAWFSGPVMESYPVQTTANVIVIESENP